MSYVASTGVRLGRGDILFNLCERYFMLLAKTTCIQRKVAYDGNANLAAETSNSTDRVETQRGKKDLWDVATGVWLQQEFGGNDISTHCCASASALDVLV